MNCECNENKRCQDEYLVRRGSLESWKEFIENYKKDTGKDYVVPSGQLIAIKNSMFDSNARYRLKLGNGNDTFETLPYLDEVSNDSLYPIKILKDDEIEWTEVVENKEYEHTFTNDKSAKYLRVVYDESLMGVRFKSDTDVQFIISSDSRIDVSKYTEWDLKVEYNPYNPEYSETVKLEYYEYIAISDYITNYISADITDLKTNVSTIETRVNTIEADVSNKADKNNPTLTGYIAMNSLGNGTNTVSLGNNNNVSNSFGVGLGNTNTVSGEASTALGTNNKVTSGFSIAEGLENTIDTNNFSSAFGQANKVHALASMAEGQSNEINATSQYSVAMGYGNNVKVNSSYSLVTGNNNSISSSIHSFVSGEGNTLTTSSDRNVVFGLNNKVDTSTYNLVNGNANTLGSTSHDSIVTGNDNSLPYQAIYSIIGGYSNSFPAGIEGSVYYGHDNFISQRIINSLILGYSNTIWNKSTSVVLIGHDNKIALSSSSSESIQNDYIHGNNNTVNDSVTNSFVLGQYNTANYSHSLTLGNHLTNSSEYQVAFGLYNEEDTNAALIIGNGTIGSRSNSFKVRKDGLVTANNDLVFVDIYEKKQITNLAYDSESSPLYFGGVNNSVKVEITNTGSSENNLNLTVKYYKNGGSSKTSYISVDKSKTTTQEITNTDNSYDYITLTIDVYHASSTNYKCYVTSLNKNSNKALSDIVGDLSLPEKPTSGTYTLKCIDGNLTWVQD